MAYPINYDFSANWTTKIKPLLDNAEVQKALTKGINKYLANFPSKNKYKKNTCPANYSSKDGYAMLMDRKREELMKKLKDTNQLPKKYLNLEKKLEKADPEYDDVDNIGYELMVMENKIMKPYFTWDKIKYDLESYYLSGSCHFYNPTFCLTLARLVEPDEVWRVQVSNKHTTVINKNNTKVFDLLYWADNDRLENHMFGDPIPANKLDVTLGGKAAYLDSLDDVDNCDD